MLDTAIRPAAVSQGIHTTGGSEVTYRTAILPPLGLQLSLRDFHGKDAARRQVALAHTVAEFLGEHGVKRAFAPTFRFTRRVAAPAELDTEIVLPNGIPVYRNETLHADAVELLEPGDAMLGSFGGCGTIVAVLGNRMVAGHGGHENLLHRELVLNQATKDLGSIVDSVAAHLGLSRAQPAQCRGSCRAFYNLPRKSYRFDFDHPRFGEYNRELERYLHARHHHEADQMLKRTSTGILLDQGHLIGAQARKYFQTVSTCLDLLKESKYAHTRHANPDMQKLRNLVIVIRLT